MPLVDTNIAIDLQRDHPPALEWEQSLDENDELAIVGFTAIELIEGCENKFATRRTESFLQLFRTYWPNHQDSQRALAAWAQARLSDGIGIADMMIGQCAVGLGVPLLTFDKHFQVVDGLTIVQPYKR